MRGALDSLGAADDDSAVDVHVVGHTVVEGLWLLG